METMVVAPTENIYLTPCPSTSSGEVDTGKPSPSSGKRRKKTQRPSRLCEFIDKQKRQVSFFQNIFGFVESKFLINIEHSDGWGDVVQ